MNIILCAWVKFVGDADISDSVSIKGIRRRTSAHILRYANSVKIYSADVILDLRFHGGDYEE
jgi:hypothetical protein